MKDIQLLIKKNNQIGGYEDIYPKTYLDAVTDKNTGTTLLDILSGFNMYFLPYAGSQELTRLLVLPALRRQGLWITYVLFDGTLYVEYYTSSDTSEEQWKLSSNWRSGNNVLVGDLTISSNGTWVINGVDTNVQATGPKGDPGTNGTDGINGVNGKTPRLRSNTSYIQYSYDGVEWYNIISLEDLKGATGASGTAATVNVGVTETLPYGSNAYVRNSGDQTSAVLDFGVVTGPPGSVGQTGAPAQISEFVAALPAYSAEYEHKMIAVGTSTPYTLWYGNPAQNAFVELGPTSEVKASVFDGGRADTKYGGARSIDCGRADSTLTI